MKFDLANQSEAGQALAYLLELTQRGKLAEVTKVSPRRSLNQNAYLHLIIGYFGLHFGYTLEEAKFLYKQINAGLYRYEKAGRIFWRSTRDLNKEDMAKSIDTFMQYSARNDCPLPLATDEGWLREIEREIERSKYYM
jgi:hypothetical protein